MQKSKISILFSSLLALSLAACNGGGGSNAGSDNNGGGGDNVTVKTLATLSGINTPYSPTCMYHEMRSQSWDIVKIDGSGSGVQFFESTGAVNNVTGLQVLNPNTICQPNKYQLTWIDNNNATQLNVFDGFGTTSIFDLSGTGLSGSQIASTSFAFNSESNYLVANSNFANNVFGLSKLNGTNPSFYSALPVGQLNSSTNSVLYGFHSAAMTGSSNTLIEQLLPSNAASNIPARYAQYDVNAESVIVTIDFVDSNSEPIAAMSGIVDYIPSSSLSLDYVIEVGLVQPSFYICKVNNGGGNVGSAICSTPFTSPVLANQYKVMRLLSFDGANIVFYGLNMMTQTVGIFSLSQN